MKVAGIAYQTPVVRYDLLAQIVIVQHRDTSTGKVEYQIPSTEEVRSEEQAALAAHPDKRLAGPHAGGDVAGPASDPAPPAAPAAGKAAVGSLPGAGSPPEGEDNAAGGRLSLIA